MRTIKEWLSEIDKADNEHNPRRRADLSDALVIELRGIFGTDDRLEEICNAERDGRLVVLPCGVDLMKIYNELTAICEGDAVENYTNGYRWGHKNGQIELIRRILNISEGVSHKPEQALKGAVNDE